LAVAKLLKKLAIANFFNSFEQASRFESDFLLKRRKDIPARWRDITEEQKKIDAIKKEITKSRFKF
jgi:hypothetical protein